MPRIEVSQVRELELNGYESEAEIKRLVWYEFGNYRIILFSYDKAGSIKASVDVVKWGKNGFEQSISCWHYDNFEDALQDFMKPEPIVFLVLSSV